jgi:hypothetical protein
VRQLYLIMPQVNDLVVNNNHSLTCMRQLYLIMPQVNDLVLNNNHSLTCMRQLDTTASYK